MVLVWVYYAGLIFFFGAEFTQVYANTYGTGVKPGKDAIVVEDKTGRANDKGQNSAELRVQQQREKANSGSPPRTRARRLEGRAMDTGQQAPQQEIRRFDIFAEWNRLKARTQHRFSDADAQAYGLAVAKIVAARKFAGHRPERVRDWKRRATQEDFTEAWWTHLGSAAEFNDKIMARMGKSFYRRVFQPAVRRAWKEGQRYEQIRDALRAPWNATLTHKKSK